MLDGRRYLAEFPEDAAETPRLLLTEELLVTLAAIEKEISAFIGRSPRAAPQGERNVKAEKPASK
jgi:hypothetical protein